MSTLHTVKRSASKENSECTFASSHVIDVRACKAYCYSTPWVVANSMSSFLLKLNFRKQTIICLSLHKKNFWKHKESPLDVALFLFYEILTALNKVSAYKAQQFLSSTINMLFSSSILKLMLINLYYESDINKKHVNISRICH